MNESLKVRVEKYARWYLRNVYACEVLEDIADDDGELCGFVTREGEDTYRFVYLSYHTRERLQHWGAGMTFAGAREKFERDMTEFFSKGEPIMGRVCYGELRALVLGEDRAIFKYVLSEVYEEGCA